MEQTNDYSIYRINHIAIETHQTTLKRIAMKDRCNKKSMERENISKYKKCASYLIKSIS